MPRQNSKKTKAWRVPDRALAKVIDALQFYADRDTYFAWAFFSDPPCGDWGDDFEEHAYHGNKPGKRARKAMRALRRALVPQLRTTPSPPRRRP